jgi:hypothetical protein
MTTRAQRTGRPARSLTALVGLDWWLWEVAVGGEAALFPSLPAAKPR